MSDCFADAAAHWCGLSARLLGWRPREFWSATPAELALSLSAPDHAAAPPPPSRDLIARLMERDAHD